jgi:hypothetical protein
LREQLYTLLTLQDVDKEIVREKKLLKKLPAKITEIENEVFKKEEKYKKLKESLKELQLKAKRKEIDVKAVNTKIDKHQDELYGGKTSDIKELKQLQKVIELLKKDRDKVEEELLVLMDEEDNIKERLSKAQEELNIAKEQLQERKIEISQQEKAVNARIEKKGRQREEIATKITDNELMKRYQILWEGKEGEVVVEIDSATCSGCNLSLPSDVIYHLQRDDVLITCPNCNRILIWKK